MRKEKIREEIRAEKITEELKEMKEKGELEGKRIFIQSGMIHSPTIYKELKEFAEKEGINIRRKHFRRKDLKERGMDEKYRELYPPLLQYQRMMKHETPGYQSIKELKKAKESEKGVDEYYKEKYSNKDKNWKKAKEEAIEGAEKAKEKLSEIDEAEKAYQAAKESWKKELMKKGKTEEEAEYEASLDVLTKMWKARKKDLREKEG